MTRKIQATIKTEINDGIALRAVENSIVVVGTYRGAVIDPETETVTSTFGDGNSGGTGASRPVAFVGDAAFELAGTGDLIEFDQLTATVTSVADLGVDTRGDKRRVKPTYPITADGTSLFFSIHNGGDHLLSRYDVSTRAFTILHSVGDHVAIAVAGPTVWVLDTDRLLHGYDKVTGEPVTGVFELPRPDPPVASLDSADQRALVVAADGTMWAIDQPSQILYQLDPSTAQVLSATHLKYRPNGLVVTDSAIWLTDTFDNRLTVIERSDLVPGS